MFGGATGRKPGTLGSYLLNGLPGRGSGLFLAVLFSSGWPLSATTFPLPDGMRTLPFAHLSVAQGLPNGTVNAIVRDRQGYIWFGTLDGLCRYDGYEVRVFKHDPLDSSSIGDNTVAMSALYLDREGRLWIGTYNNGLDRYDPATGKFIHFRNDPGNPASLSNNSVRCILQDRTGDLWVGTFGGGLNRMGATEGRFERFVHDSTNPNSLSDNLVRCLGEDATGSLWIGTKGGGLSRLDASRRVFTHFTNRTGDPNSLTGGEVWSICVDHASTVWIGTEHGLSRYESATRSFTRFTHNDRQPSSIGGNFVTAVCEDPFGMLWIGTYGGGLDRFDRENSRFVHYRQAAGDPSGLSSNLVRSLYMERDSTESGARRVIWVGTDGTGVDREDTEVKKFILLRNDPRNKGSLNPGTVYSFCEDHAGVLWVGTTTGLCRLVTENGQRATFVRVPLRNNLVTAIEEDSSGVLWVGTWGSGVETLARDRRTSRQLSGEDGGAGGLSSNNVNAVYRDRNGAMWIGTSVGLDGFDQRTGRFRHYGPDAATSATVSRDQVRVIFEDREGSFWVGSDGGLKRLDRETGELLPVRAIAAGNPGDERVYALYEDGRGDLWIGTSGGLLQMNARRDSIVRYDAGKGLAASYVRGIAADDMDNLWLTTTNGLVRFNKAQKTFHSYDADDGLQGSEFSGASRRLRDGKILIGGLNGFNAFDPRDIEDNRHIPPVVLTGFSVFEKPVNLGLPIDAIHEITLGYNQDFFSFAFAALDFTNPSKNSYAYMLEGFDKEWVNAGTRRFAYYTNVSPGDYLFRVRGSNDDGIWNEEGTAVRVLVEPPYWQTWWFRLLMGAALVTLLTILYNYRVSKLLEMERMRLRISSDLHDDIGSSLSSIALITDMVRQKLPDDLQERRQLSEVSRAARNTADALKDIVWLISPEHEKVDDIILRMKDGASKFLAGTAYEFHCPEVALTGVLDMEFRRNILLMFKESLNNIAKYSRATKVDITIGEYQRVFAMTITDNGVGFDETAVRKGNGLNNLRRRAEKIGGTMTITSTPGKGTTVDLRVKIP